MVKDQFRFYNGFGIAPSKNYVAAGYDFYIPNITTMEQAEKMVEALVESKRTTFDDMNRIIYHLEECFSEYDHLRSIKYDKPLLYNIAHLFISIDPCVWDEDSVMLEDCLDSFVSYKLLFDANGTPGIRVSCNEHILVNSGIKTALDPETAGIFFNKSGRGNQGWDVRACVVDEDYAGYVHLSLAYTKDYTCGEIYAGDKLSQMVIVPIVKYKESLELTEEEYLEVMKNSERGIKGFGSSNEKH